MDTYGIFTYIYRKKQPNVDKYNIIHCASGILMIMFWFSVGMLLIKRLRPDPLFRPMPPMLSVGSRLMVAPTVVVNVLKVVFFPFYNFDIQSRIVLNIYHIFQWCVIQFGL